MNNIKRQTIIFSLITFLLCLFSFGRVAIDDKAKIAAEMEKSIQNELLKPWYPKSVDKQFGGFLSRFSFDFKPVDPQDKMVVTQARHTWTNAKASLIYPDAHYKSSAKHGFNFLRDVMWDKTYGGFYTLVDRTGKVKASGFAEKEAYGNSFGLYGLAAYYQASGDTSALNLAKKEFMWLERHSHDPIHKGYFQHMRMDGTPEQRGNVPSTSQWGYKDQNTSIHLLESFTELYTVWPDSLVKERLTEMLLLVRDKITTPKGYLILFFEPDWTPVSMRDSSEASILKHRSLDHVSFGHDVETAYLMIEASHVLGLEHDSVTMKVAKRMVDHALRNGWDNDVGGFYDEGYYFKGKSQITIIKDTKNWWAQAEGLNSLLLMSDLYPKDELRYFDKFKKLWTYAQTYLIDHDYGDWYQGGLDKEPEQKKGLKGHIWKATYHQYRALANCVQRLTPDNVPPGAPGKVTVKRANDGFVLQWTPSRDNRNILGYNIYSNNKRIGFTPLREYDLGSGKKYFSYSIKAVDLQGNESREAVVTVN
jgi:mannobiose 2-epimerase